MRVAQRKSLLEANFLGVVYLQAIVLTQNSYSSAYIFYAR